MKNPAITAIITCISVAVLSCAQPGKRAQNTSSPAEDSVARPDMKHRAGLEMYSLRVALKSDFPGTLKTIREMGITEVEVPELYGRDAAVLKKELDAAGLKPTSMLVSYEKLRDSLPAVISAAKKLGVVYTGVAWIPHEKDFNKTDAANAVALFNAVGEKMKAEGIHFFYHPHGYEFVADGNGTLFDTMAAQMKAGTADFQLDVFWALRGGADPLALLKKYPGRFVSMHLKDLKKGVATGDHTGTAPDETSVVLGTGQVDWLPILQEAERQKIPHYFIEEENPDALVQIPQSLVYLQKLN
ncbi:MAG: sugar phosphate isomerase/epimerase [Mucilaginibacter polytrichastri]|nr:sugar phosphate isomerase/epimerase [Mucilaginibacter polytrichastri]